MSFQQREPFKKRWFTLCSVNRKLIYFKTPLVNRTHIFIEYLFKHTGVWELFLFDRMPRNWAQSSSARRTTSTLFQRAAARAREEAAGAVASGWRRPGGSSCSSVSRSRTRGSGWRPSERSSLSPWPQRTTPVRPYRYPCWLLMESQQFYLFICFIVDEASWRRGKWPVLLTGLGCWTYSTDSAFFVSHHLE